MDEEASIILGDAIAFCQRDGQDARLINMLGQSRAISLTEDTLTIEAPSRFAIAQLKKHQPTIEAYLEEIAFAPIALDIVAPQGAATESAAATAAAAAPAASPAVPASAGDVPTIEHQRSDVSRETMAPLPTAAATPANAPVTHMPIAHDAAASADSGIAIKNTLSADDFRRMMNQMKGGAPAKSTQAAAPASPVPAPTVPAEQNTDGARSPRTQNLPLRTLSTAPRTAMPIARHSSLPPSRTSAARAHHCSSTANRAWARRTCCLPSKTSSPRSRPRSRSSMPTPRHIWTT